MLKGQNSRLSQVKGSVVPGAAKGWTLGWSGRAKLSPFAGQGLQFARLRIWWRGLPAVEGGRRGPAVVQGGPGARRWVAAVVKGGPGGRRWDLAVVKGGPGARRWDLAVQMVSGLGLLKALDRA